MLRPLLPEGVIVPERRPTNKSRVRLTPQMEHAAVLDAWGSSGRAVASEVGVAPETVSRWRRDPLYIERRQQELAAVLADKSGRRERDKQGAFDAMESARDMLVSDLSAVDPDGNALHGIRHSAAKILAEDKARTSEYAERSGVSVDAKVAVGAVFHVYPDGKVIEAQTVIDVEAKEVDD